MTPSLMNSGRASTTGTRLVRTSRTAWWNSGSAGFRAVTRSIRPLRYAWLMLMCHYLPKQALVDRQVSCLRFNWLNRITRSALLQRFFDGWKNICFFR